MSALRRDGERWVLHYDPRIALLHDVGLPFVVHGRATGADLPYSWVDVNNRRAFLRATEFLLDLGHSQENRLHQKASLLPLPDQPDKKLFHLFLFHRFLYGFQCQKRYLPGRPAAHFPMRKQSQG